MFCLKTILFIVLLSVVNAASTVNMYDDGNDLKAVEENSTQEVHGCDTQACDQLCRILKFPGGACVNGRCECDNLKQPETELALVKDKGLGSCNRKACDQLCRRLGFPSGVCVGDKCKCDNFRLDNNKDLRNDLSTNEKENANQCNDAECENYCQKLGLVSGYCFQDRCICNKKKQDKTKNFQDCDFALCIAICQGQNDIGGMCIDDICFCY